MIRLQLDKPPSVNALFATDWKTHRRFKSRKYEQWLSAAEASLWIAKCRPIPGPVHIIITVQDVGAVDLANHEKCLVDFLVRHELIENDNRKIVRKIIMQWGEVDGCVIEVMPI